MDFHDSLLDCNKGVQFLEKLQGVEMEDSCVPPPSQSPSSQHMPSQNVSSPNPPSQPLSTSTSQVQWKDHPVYRKYFKLLQMGMPVEHVRSKMRMDGLDERLLELRFFASITCSNSPDSFVPDEYV